MRTLIRITVLVENRAEGRGIRGEHGLSLWIEGGSQKVLFDTGTTAEVLFHNAESLGVDPGSADAVVLSHGHDDHTGGLEAVLRRGGRPGVFLHPGSLARRFVRRRDGSVDEIGVPPGITEDFFQAHVGSLTWTDHPAEVTEWLRVTGPIPRVTDYEDTGGDFFLDRECSTPDPIADDQAAFFDTPEGTVVILGCGHSGVVNTLRHVQDLTGGRPIHAVIGGMHLVNASPERLDRTVEALRPLDVKVLAPAHCTGARSQLRLGSAFPESWVPCAAGSRFEFGTGS